MSEAAQVWMSWLVPALTLGWLLRSLFRARRCWALSPARWELALAVGLALLGLWVRLSFVPALAGHRFEGHEASYLELFLGQRAPGAGDTTLYPVMQAWWWALGRLLPGEPAVPVVVSALLGLLAGALLAASVGLLAGRRAGWVAAVILALHPAQSAWSGSAYNVILPHLLECLSFLAVCRLVAGGAPEDEGPLAQVAGAALGLAMACRLEVGVALAPLALLALDRPGLARRLWPALLVGLALGLAAVWPLLGGGTPGSDERELALRINALWTAPYGRLGSTPGLLLLGLGAGLGLYRQPRRGAALILGSLAGHLALATFDDMGERHILALLPGIVWALAAGATAFGWRGLPIAALALALEGGELVDLRERYEGSERAFAALLSQPPYDALPRRYLRAPSAPGRSPVDPRCGIVSEDPRVTSPPYRSHFNLWDPAEAEALRGPDGCLQWCLDAADWRWSSRAVRDRALRVAWLYPLRPVAVVEEPLSGYACLVVDLGPRQCCGPGLPASGARHDHGDGVP